MLVGYARCSTDGQDLTVQRNALAALGAQPERIYVDHDLTGTNRARPGLREALAACRARLRGKQPKLTPRQEAHRVALHQDGQHASTELAELFSVARSTVYRALARARGAT